MGTGGLQCYSVCIGPIIWNLLRLHLSLYLGTCPEGPRIRRMSSCNFPRCMGVALRVGFRVEGLGARLKSAPLRTHFLEDRS